MPYRGIADSPLLDLITLNRALWRKGWSFIAL